MGDDGARFSRVELPPALLHEPYPRLNEDTFSEEDSREQPSEEHEAQEANAESDWAYQRNWQQAADLQQVTPAPKKQGCCSKGNLLCFLTFMWLAPLMLAVFRKKKNVSSAKPHPSDVDDSHRENLQRLWDEEVARVGEANASLTRVVFLFLKWDLFKSTLAAVSAALAMFFGPSIVVHELLRHISAREKSPELDVVGLALALGLVSTEFLKVFSLSALWAYNVQMGLKLKVAFCRVAFHKLVSLRGLNSKMSKALVCVATQDGHKVCVAIGLLTLIVTSILLAVLGTIYAAVVISPITLTGMAIFFVGFLPIETLLTKRMKQYRQNAMAIKDVRTQTVTEVLNSIKLIKMYAWESCFESKIKAQRKQEEAQLKRVSWAITAISSTTNIMPAVSIVSIFLVYVAVGRQLDISEAFSCVAIMNALRFCIAVMPQAVRSMIENILCVERLKGVLLIKNPEPYLRKEENADLAVVFNNATLSWAHSSERGMANRAMDADVSPHSTLKKLSFTLPKGKLIGVCGNVGSGKTSLISSILEQLHLLEGSISANGTFAYVSQQAWIFHGTVRDNILIGAPLDQAKYDRVLDVCCLRADLAILPYGDQTEIGDRGLNLSGGQKQRISLARAVYSNRDIYLLDDPLSALDAHVGKRVFEECVKKELRGKSILLVTHQLQYLEFCDDILVLDNGEIKENGDHLTLIRAGGRYTRFMENYNRNRPQEQEGEQAEAACANSEKPAPTQPAEEALDPAPQPTDGEEAAADASAAVPAVQLISEEGCEEETLSFSVYNRYIKAAGGYYAVFLVILNLSLMIGITAFSNWWLSYWLRQGSGLANITITNMTSSGDILLNPDLNFYQSIYGMLIGVMVGFAVANCFLFTHAIIKASSKHHNTMLKKVMASPMSFFDTTPTGRILNRFSRDQEDMDVPLPNHMDQLLQLSLLMLATGIIISVSMYYILGAFIFLAIFFAILLRFSKRFIHQSKTMDTNSLSLCLSLTNSTLQGLSTIHAYDLRDSQLERFRSLMDANSYYFYLFNSGIRLLGFMLDLVALITISLIAVTVVVNQIQDSASKGLALSYTIQLTGVLQFVVRQSLDLRGKFISVARLQEYMQNLPSEEHCTGDYLPDTTWPQRGGITFKDYTMRYRENTPIVLNRLNFHIRAGEKLGIVGRTGSGKSSLVVALLRLADPAEGTIEIDDVDITSLHLRHLRSKLSIIPQDPVLFVGTVRYNLDPFDAHQDEEIWEALERAYMKDTILRLEGELNASVMENGENFSVGERQLLCMARALLRNSKIILLDEATASIDAETDALIQTTIRNSFQPCTVLTIAHRMNTVLHSDRILVMDKGQVAELESPDVLRQRPDSLFSSLLRATNTVRA